MKKIYLLFLFAVAMVTVNAQSVFTEYFQDATSGMLLEEYNDWYVSFKEADALGESPVIEDEMLFYEGYIGSDTGMVAVLDSLMGKTDDTKRISTKVVTINGDTLMPGAAGNVMYAAFIVDISTDGLNSWRDFFTWEASSGSNWSRGRVFAKTWENGTDVSFSISKNSSSSGNLDDGVLLEGGINIPHLLVVKYEVVEGEANDVVSLYVNPDPALAEDDAAQVVPLQNVDEQSDYNEDSQIKINLRQRGIAAKVGGIRVGTMWEYVLQGDPTVGVSEAKEAAANTIYAYDNAIITSAPGTVELYDMTGRKVMTEITSGRIETSLNGGIYLVRFEDYSGNVTSSKVFLK